MQPAADVVCQVSLGGIIYKQAQPHPNDEANDQNQGRRTETLLKRHIRDTRVIL
jgi:hypothetical protein